MASEWISSVANVAGVVTGTFTVIGLASYRAHLPRARLRRLDELIQEVQDMLHDAIEEDCLPDQVIAADVRRRLVK